ncbi:MAG: thioredoxin-disulfide reductase [Oligoflexia bacterium]|nr:thioredoxin-disulfide reductase [Oligoflexia bacterium]
MIKPESLETVTILGSGPAGLTAAIYAARADLKPLLIHGGQPGGQLTTTTEVENFPGFEKGVMGPELMDACTKQAERFGTRFIQATVTKVDLTKRPFRITLDNGTSFETKTLIAATGASAKYLGIPKEQSLIGKGVSACATCDGFFFRNQDIAVIGGGDTAAEEATFLTKFAKTVYLIHRRDELRASKAMQNRVLNNPKIKMVWDSAVEEILGDGEVVGLKIKNLKTNEFTKLDVTGMFVAIGHKPNSDLFKGSVDMDELGYIITHDGTKTKVPGFYACGDLQDHIYRQAVTAAGTGCMSALDAERFLQSEEG